MRVPNLSLLRRGAPSSRSYSKLFTFLRKGTPAGIDFLIFGSCAKYILDPKKDLPGVIIFSDVDIFIFVEDLADLCSFSWYNELLAFKTEHGVFLSIRIVSTEQVQWNHFPASKGYWEAILGSEYFVSKEDLLPLVRGNLFCQGPVRVNELVETLVGRIKGVLSAMSETKSPPTTPRIFEEVGFLISKVKNLPALLEDVGFWRNLGKHEVLEEEFISKIGDFEKEILSAKEVLLLSFEARDEVRFLDSLRSISKDLLGQTGIGLLESLI